MKFGIRLPVTGPSSHKKPIVETTIFGEEYGYDSVWTQSHILWTKAQHSGQLSVGSIEAITEDQDPNKFDSITVLSYLAGITARIRLGFSVFVIPMSHPVVTAKIIADLDVLSEGRVIFCTSPGGPLIKPDFDLLGINHEKRAEIAEEYIPAVRNLWMNDDCSFDGKFVKYENISLYPKLVQKPHPPIWIAGGNPKSVSRAARYGSGWMLSTIDPRGLLGNTSDYSKSIDMCRSRAKKFGRDPNEINENALEIFGCIKPTDDEAFTFAAKTIDARRNLHAKHFTNLPSIEQVLKTNLIGSPKTIVNKIEEFQRAGATTLEIRFIAKSFDEMKDMMKMFSTQVMQSF